MLHYWDKFTTTYDKCDTYDALCNDRDDTCARGLETLEMSAAYFYMVKTTHLYKGDLVKPLEHAYIHDVTTNMRKEDILPIL